MLQKLRNLRKWFNGLSKLNKLVALSSIAGVATFVLWFLPTDDSNTTFRTAYKRSAEAGIVTGNNANIHANELHIEHGSSIEALQELAVKQSKLSSQLKSHEKMQVRVAQCFK